MFYLITIILLIGFVFFVIKHVFGFYKDYDELLYSKEKNIREYAIKEREMMKKSGRLFKILSVILILVIISLLIKYFG